ncbi:MAG: PadR family transcriptional regulator [Candidatus Micrarchaeales archaeon]|jgi:DNA-binding PadR family transcriptional regulator
MQGDIFSPKSFLNAKMRNGILSSIVLIHIKKKSTYPYSLLKHFKKFSHPVLGRIDKNDIYNMLSSLEHKGFVKSKVTFTGAKAQKVYSITPKGTATVNSFRRIFVRFMKDAKNMIESEFNE